MDAMRVRSFVDHSYRRTYGARRVATFSEYLTLGGTCRAALGYRRAGLEPLFLEAYLDVPIENAVSKALCRPVRRDAIVEIGNLAADNAWAMIALWGDAANDLGGTSEVVVATLTSPLRRMFSRIGIPLYQLTRADPARLGDRSSKWGSYYAQDPYVCAGSIADGQRAIAAFLSRRPERAA